MVETGLSLVTSSLYVYVLGMLKNLEEKWLRIEVEATWCGGLVYPDGIVLLVRDQVHYK